MADGKPGRRAFVPTDEQRKLVEELAGLGVPHKDIAMLVHRHDGVSIHKETLRKYFEPELQAGMARANAEVARSLFRMALGTTTVIKIQPDGTEEVVEQGVKPEVGAAIFWTKCRMGWSDRQVVVHDVTKEFSAAAASLDRKLSAALEPEPAAGLSIQPNVAGKGSA